MNRSTFWALKYMNGPVFSKARYMNGVGFEKLAHTPIPQLVVGDHINTVAQSVEQQEVRKMVLAAFSLGTQQ